MDTDILDGMRYSSLFKTISTESKQKLKEQVLQFIKTNHTIGLYGITGLITPDETSIVKIQYSHTSKNYIDRVFKIDVYLSNTDGTVQCFDEAVHLGTLTVTEEFIRSL